MHGMLRSFILVAWGLCVPAAAQPMPGSDDFWGRNSFPGFSSFPSFNRRPLQMHRRIYRPAWEDSSLERSYHKSPSYRQNEHQYHYHSDPPPHHHGHPPSPHYSHPPPHHHSHPPSPHYSHPPPHHHSHPPSPHHSQPPPHHHSHPPSPHYSHPPPHHHGHPPSPHHSQPPPHHHSHPPSPHYSHPPPHYHSHPPSPHHSQPPPHHHSHPPSPHHSHPPLMVSHHRFPNGVGVVVRRQHHGSFPNHQADTTTLDKLTQEFEGALKELLDLLHSDTSPSGGSGTGVIPNSVAPAPEQGEPGLFGEIFSNIWNKQEDFAQQCLNAHNQKRALHGAPPLELSEELSTHSESWAKHLASIDRLEASGKSDYGENLFKTESFDPWETVYGSAVIEKWYSEIKNYDYEKQEKSDGIFGNFTQLVWNGSEKLGVGKAKSETGTTYVVCSYSPPGNKEGNYGENVRPPLRSSSHHPKRTGSEVNNRFGFPQDPHNQHTGSRWARPAPPQDINQKHDGTEKENTPHQKGNAAGSTDTPDDFAKECLEIHNQKRALHGSPPLTYSEEISVFSRQWANKLAAKNIMEHSIGSGYGENLFWSSNPYNVFCSVAVESWYNETKDYDYATQDRTEKMIGHFTQVVWKSSKELGCGKATSKGGTIVVCNYSPAGNVVSYYGQNVPRLGGATDPPKSEDSEMKNFGGFPMNWDNWL